MPTPFKYHQDPGHGWLEVTTDDIKEVGLTPAAFTSYTYVNGGTFFLEEDCDMALFLQAYSTWKGEVAPMVSVYHEANCFCRAYSRCSG